MLSGKTIHEAIEQADLDQLKALLNRGVSLPSILSNGFTPLTWASKLGNGNMISLLVKEGADIHQKDKKGIAPQFNTSMNVHDIPEILSERKYMYEPLTRHNLGGPFFSNTAALVTEARNRFDRVKRFGHVLGITKTISIKQKAIPQLEAQEVFVDTEGLKCKKKTDVILQDLILRYLFNSQAKLPKLFLDILKGTENNAEINIKRISANSIVNLSAEYPSHRVGIAIFENFLVYANRPNIRIYKLSKEQKANITIEWLNNIEFAPSEKKLISNLNLIVGDVEKPNVFIKRSEQKRMNCSLDNPKSLISGIIYVYFILNGMMHDKALLESDKIYKEFTAIIRDTEIDKAIYSMKHGDEIDKKIYLELFEQYLTEHHASNTHSSSKKKSEEVRVRKILLSLDLKDRERMMIALQKNGVDLSSFLNDKSIEEKSEVCQPPKSSLKW